MPRYAAYSHTGWGAEHGESDKRSSWDTAIERRAELSAGGVEFVPFSIEAGGVWGPAARKFFRECIALADDDRDIDLYHWSSTRFSRAWFDSLSVLVARGRAKVSAAAAASDCEGVSPLLSCELVEGSSSISSFLACPRVSVTGQGVSNCPVISVISHQCMTWDQSSVDLYSYSVPF